MVDHESIMICVDLEFILRTVGSRVIQLRQNAEADSDFSRMKADKTLVTKADEVAEDLIRQWIEGRFPQDSIRGEEREAKQGGSRIWIIDPIDGTYNYSHFGKMFSISVGLVQANTPKLGVLFFPAEDINISAIENGGALVNGQALAATESKTSLHEAKVIVQNTSLYAAYFAQPKFAKTVAQQNCLPLTPLVITGTDASFTYAFLQLVSRVGIDAMMHPGATPYDIGAMCAIAGELGYSVSGYDGESIDFAKDTISIVIAKNAILHGQILKALAQGS